jgi:hypothetical protein
MVFRFLTVLTSNTDNLGTGISQTTTRRSPGTPFLERLKQPAAEPAPPASENSQRNAVQQRPPSVSRSADGTQRARPNAAGQREQLAAGPRRTSTVIVSTDDNAQRSATLFRLHCSRGAKPDRSPQHQILEDRKASPALCAHRHGSTLMLSRPPFATPIYSE